MEYKYLKHAQTGDTYAARTHWEEGGELIVDAISEPLYYKDVARWTPEDFEMSAEDIAWANEQEWTIQVLVSERKLYQCKRCKWQWMSRMDKPTVCPKCHSPYWDKPKKNLDKI